MLGFAITFANLAAQIGYPFLFSSLHTMSSLDIGIALIPAALATALVGVIAGRLVDKIGAAGPLRLGAILMIVGAITISTWSGSSAWTVAILAVVFAVGFALVNTPLAAVVSLLVDPKDLAPALSLNTMMFFIGGSFGSSLFTSIVIGTGPDANAVNPFHDGAGAGFSNAFAALIIPIGIGLALSSILPRKSATTADAISAERDNWTHDCNVPWVPDLEPTGATSS